MVKQLSMHTCTTPVKPGHAEQQCRRMTTTEQPNSTGYPCQGAHMEDSHITKFTQSLIPQENQASPASCTSHILTPDLA